MIRQVARTLVEEKLKSMNKDNFIETD